MLVVISDLHFEEVASDRVSAFGAPYPVDFTERNLRPEAFNVVFRDLADAARRDGAKRLDLVLAGDVFDLHRTSLWFSDDLRPYLPCPQVTPGSPIESKIMRILEAIAAEPPVASSLAALRQLSTGKPTPGAPAGLETPALETEVHYLPGNHDRLLNATPALRARASALLGIAAPPTRFPHVIDFRNPRVLVRHGHEYDPLNFGASFASDAPIPANIPLDAYDDWTFGDFITVEVATGLPYAFRAVHGDGIPRDLLKATVFRRLLEFDDVRPQSQLVPFLLTVPGFEARVVWKELEPAVRLLLGRIAQSAHLEAALIKGRVSPIWKALLDSRLWNLGLPLRVVQTIGGLAARACEPAPAQASAREEVIQQGRKRFVIAGHTHHPNVALLSNDGQFDRYFVDTGTWRNVVFSSSDGEFSNAKALTYVVVYSSNEDGRAEGKEESFDYWSGYTKRW
jgi:UDP-2,3-diacylglucosamine pyrophosphatase LpxH